MYARVSGHGWLINLPAASGARLKGIALEAASSRDIFASL
jgi:hypothetical protein